MIGGLLRLPIFEMVAIPGGVFKGKPIERSF
jgi:hypothetical protein